MVRQNNFKWPIHWGTSSPKIPAAEAGEAGSATGS